MILDLAFFSLKNLEFFDFLGPGLVLISAIIGSFESFKFSWFNGRLKGFIIITIVIFGFVLTMISIHDVKEENSDYIGRIDSLEKEIEENEKYIKENIQPDIKVIILDTLEDKSGYFFLKLHNISLVDAEISLVYHNYYWNEYYANGHNKWSDGKPILLKSDSSMIYPINFFDVSGNIFLYREALAKNQLMDENQFDLIFRLELRYNKTGSYNNFKKSLYYLIVNSPTEKLQFNYRLINIQDNQIHTTRFHKHIRKIDDSFYHKMNE